MKHGKKYRAIEEKIDMAKEYELGEAIDLLKANAGAKFDESVEIHIKLNINAKKTNEQVRATVVLPHGTGKGKRVAVVTESAAKEAEKAARSSSEGRKSSRESRRGRSFPDPRSISCLRPRT
jgi:large subunit ribosomal protein L1